MDALTLSFYELELSEIWLLGSAGLSLAASLAAGSVQLYRRTLLKKLLSFKGSTLEYWKLRSRFYGRRAVLNAEYSERDIERVTDQQVATIFPHIRQRLAGWEKTALDFGCGPGRFSRRLADLIQGRVIAVDPIVRFLDIAPRSLDVEYRAIENFKIPAETQSIDLGWICLVLGGISDSELSSSLKEIRRVMKPKGLLCVVENTSDFQDKPHWKYRNVREYQKLFDFCDLEHVHDYDEVGEHISILIGRIR